MKNNTLYIIFAAIFIALLAWGIFRTEPTDWGFSYSKYDKKPFGAYILHQTVKDLFPNKPFVEKHKDEIKEEIHRGEGVVDEVAIEELKEATNADDFAAQDTNFTAAEVESDFTIHSNTNNYIAPKTEHPQNFIFFNQTFSMNNAENVQNLFEKVSEGNEVFIAAEDFSDEIKSRLGFQLLGENTNTLHYDIYVKNLREPAPKKVNFTNPKLVKKEGFCLNELATTHYFEPYSLERAENKPVVLAVNEMQNPILVKFKYGHGNFILCSTPLAFTNYFLLTKDGEAFVNNALSYLPVQETVWDEYYKFDNLKDVEEGRSRALRYIQSQPPLNWAMWLMIVTCLIYMVVEMKRRQRIIAEIKPLQNSTLEFTETIGQLYFRSQDHKNVAEKISRTFLDYIRNRYYLRTQEFDKDFFDSLAAKSGVTRDYLVELFDQIKRIRRSAQILEDDLISLSSKVEKFYEIAK